MRITSGAAENEISRILSNQPVAGQLEVQPEFSAQIASGTTYEIHRYDPRVKMTALNQARVRAYPDICRIVYDDTTTADGRSMEYTIPAGIRKGPAFVFQESPLHTDSEWSFLANPTGRDISPWRSTNMSVSTYQRSSRDLLVPKLEDVCTRFVVDDPSSPALHDQAVDDMTNDLTASQAAGRVMSFARWVYCLVPDRVRPFIEDDDDFHYGDYHPGTGWALLHVEHEIAQNNASDLAVGIQVDAGEDPVQGFVERSWFYYGPHQRVTEVYSTRLPVRIKRDDAKQAVQFQHRPMRGRQLRFIGRNLTSKIPNDFAQAMTQEIEVDEPQAELFYAYAAQVLLEGEMMNAPDAGEIRNRVNVVLERRGELSNHWPFNYPAGGSLKGWWVS